jgi:sarcosine oxidase, subunit beta
MARVVVAGAGAIGASVAYHLALLGADDVVLADSGDVAGGATAKAMGGVRQQFSTAAEVRLAQASIRFFAELGTVFFQQVGYLFLATTEAGLAELEERHAVQFELGVPVERVDAARVAALVPGLETADVLGGVHCAEDGTAIPGDVTRELVGRGAALGVELREQTDALALDREVLVVACGPSSARVAERLGVELPIRPLCRQLVRTTPVAGLSDRLPMTVESETGFHFRRRDDALVLAMPETVPRWGFDEGVDDELAADWLGRLHRRFPVAVDAQIETAWAGLYDMTPDAHPIVGFVGDGVYAACGFSGHGFMQSPAVGRGAAEEILGLTPSLDLSPYRLERFAAGAVFPERVVL